jgi:hypothetical protein
MTTLTSNSVLQGQQFSRCKERLSTNGFAVEVDVAAAAIYVGPDSDYFEYGVYYYDPSNNYDVKLATITPFRPWVGRLQADNVVEPPKLVQRTVTNKDIDPKARLLVIPEDGFDRAAFFGGEGAADRVFGFFDPRLDIIVANTERIPPVTGRSDFRFDTALLIPPTAERAFSNYYFPVYGRRRWTLSMQWIDGESPTVFPPNPQPDVLVFGLRSSNNNERMEQSLLGSTGVLFPAVDNVGTTVIHYQCDQLKGPASRVNGNIHDAYVPPSTQQNPLGCFDYVEITIRTLGDDFPGANPEDYNSGGYRMLFTAED